jgi:AbrB family looped-hinge helix DNA binding protein
MEFRMSLVTTLTSKGQVTVPKEVRDALGLKPRDKVEMFVKDGAIWLRKADSSSPEEPPGRSHRERIGNERASVGRDESCNG